MLPPASRLLRLLAFAVPALLAVSAVQPPLAALAGGTSGGWALGLALPCAAAAGGLLLAARLTDPGDVRQPPWYSAWALAPGAFVLAGAAAMCLYGALVASPAIRAGCWLLLGAGSTLWTGGLWWVRWAAR